MCVATTELLAHTFALLAGARHGKWRRNEKGKTGKNAILGEFGGHNANRSEPKTLERLGRRPPVVAQLGVYSRLMALRQWGCRRGRSKRCLTR